MQNEAIAKHSEWSGPHGGLPPLALRAPEAIGTLVDEALQDWHDRIQAIAADPDPPTFDNTVGALETAIYAFENRTAAVWVWFSTCSTPALQHLEERITPKVASIEDEIVQSAPLYQRIRQVRAGAEAYGLTTEQIRLLDHMSSELRRRGAEISPPQKRRLAQINQELATAYAVFRRNLLADEQRAVLVEDATALDGLSPATRRSMAHLAAERGYEGQWAIQNTRSAVEAVLSSATDRALRERVWRAYTRRGDGGDANDNNALITKILTLRTEYAALLGAQSYAHWAIEDQMARIPSAAMSLLRSMWEPATARAREELVEQAHLAGHTIEPWDTRFYQERVRHERFDLDDSTLRPYLQLDRMREAMFWVAERLHGLQFHRLDTADVPLHHPSVSVYRVARSDGEHVGVWYFDPYARPGKRSGAWMAALRTQGRRPIHTSPVVINVCNFVQDGDQTLLSHSDAHTLFHEFGHALHGLLSQVDHPTLAGTRLPRDFVEFPSQLNEHWLLSREVLERFATHVETGEPMPAHLLDAIEASRTFNQGFATTEYLSSALLDLELHLRDTPPADPADFERALLAELDMPSAIVPRHRPPHFQHIFGGDGYAARYYSYLWADMLTADAFEAFREAGSVFDPPTAKRLRETVLQVGNSVDPSESFERFRGRPPLPEPLMRDRGFTSE